MTYFCPVCGYPGLDEPPYLENEAGSFNICPCCFVEFGFDDGGRQGKDLQDWISVAQDQWIAQGMRWSSTVTGPPARWDPPGQLANLRQDKGPAAGMERYGFDDAPPGGGSGS